VPDAEIVHDSTRHVHLPAAKIEAFDLQDQAAGRSQAVATPLRRLERNQ
jgi:hypothetical protein